MSSVQAIVTGPHGSSLSHLKSSEEIQKVSIFTARGTQEQRGRTKVAFIPTLQSSLTIPWTVPDPVTLAHEYVHADFRMFLHVVRSVIRWAKKGPGNLD